MIAPRAERRGLRAGRPVLVVGAAPSRSGGDISTRPGGTHAFGRLAGYCGAPEEMVAEAFDFCNVLDDWPGKVHVPSGGGVGEKWDGFPAHDSWEVGQRVSLLGADLLERPRHYVVFLGGWAGRCATFWLGLQPHVFLLPQVGPARADVVVSPHPSGTSMWWNYPENRRLGEEFWHGMLAYAGRAHPRAPVKVPLAVRTKWLVDLVAQFGTDESKWPEECVDWPFVDPPGRPQAMLRGNSVPAAHVALDLTGHRRPDKVYQALHSCDRGGDCVNARHLRWGTELENRLDQSARARGAIGRVGLETARSIRRDLEQISEAYGVPMDAIQRIAGGRSWAEESWEG